MIQSLCDSENDKKTSLRQFAIRVWFQRKYLRIMNS